MHYLTRMTTPAETGNSITARLSEQTLLTLRRYTCTHLASLLQTVRDTMAEEQDETSMHERGWKVLELHALMQAYGQPWDRTGEAVN